MDFTQYNESFLWIQLTLRANNRLLHKHRFQRQYAMVYFHDNLVCLNL